MPSAKRQRQRTPTESEVRAANTTSHLFVGHRQYNWMTPGQAAVRPVSSKTRPGPPPAPSSSGATSTQPSASRRVETTPRASSPSTSSAAIPATPSNSSPTEIRARSQYPLHPHARAPSVYPPSSTVVSPTTPAPAHQPVSRPASTTDRASTRPSPTTHNDMLPFTVLPPHQSVLPSPTPSNEEPKAGMARPPPLVQAQSASASSRQSPLSIDPVPYGHNIVTSAISPGTGIALNSPLDGLSLQTPITSNPTTPAFENGQTFNPQATGQQGILAALGTDERRRIFNPLALAMPNVALLANAALKIPAMHNFVRLLKDALVPGPSNSLFLPDTHFGLIVQMCDFARISNGLPQQTHNIKHIHEAMHVLDTFVFTSSFPTASLHDLISPPAQVDVLDLRRQRNILKIFSQVRTCLEALGTEYARVSQWVREDGSSFVFEDLIVTFRIPSRIIRRELASAFLASTYPASWAQATVRAKVLNILAQNELEYYKRANQGSEAVGRTAEAAINYYRSQLRVLLSGRVPAQWSGPACTGTQSVMNGSPTGLVNANANANFGQMVPSVMTAYQAQQQGRSTQSPINSGRPVLQSFPSGSVNTTGGFLPQRQAQPSGFVIHSQGLPPSNSSGRRQSTHNVRYQVVSQPVVQTQSLHASAPFSDPSRRPSQSSGAFWPRPGAAAIQAAPPEPFKHALHQAHLVSPNLQYAEPFHDRLYRFVESFPLHPVPIIQAELPEGLPPEYFYNPPQHWDFDIPASIFARLPTIQVSGTARTRLVNSQSVLMRLRCCKSAESLSEWVVQDTDWPTLTNFAVNETRLTPRRKLHNGRDLPIDVSEAVHEGRNTVHFYNARRRKDPLLGYRVAVEMVVQTSNAAILASVKTIPAEIAWQSLKQKLSGTGSPTADGDDDELLCLDSTLNVSLACIFLQRVWTVPARGAACKHTECFDLQTFLDTRSRKAPNQPSSPDDWRCPLCKGDARPNVLVIDGWLAAVRERLVEEGRLDSVRAIEVDDAGEWIAKDSSNGSSKRARESTGLLEDSPTNGAKDANGPGPAKRPRSEPIVIELD